MLGNPEHALADLPTSAQNRTISSRSRISHDSSDEGPAQNPFIDQRESVRSNQASQPYDPAPGRHLLSNDDEQTHKQDPAVLRDYTLEWMAWTVAAISLVCLVIVFAIYSDKPLRQWKGDITPGAAVAILSQLGQTSILAPVTAFLPGTLRTLVYGSVADPMSVAIIDGLLRKDISPSDVKGNCVTGNCTWEDYQSLGVCATVTDVSSSIISKCGKDKTQFKQPGCNYSVAAIDQDPTARNTTLQTYKFGETLWVGASDTQNFKSTGLNTLVQFYVIYVPDLNRWESLDFTQDHKDKLVTLQATLSLCVRKYHTSMTFSVTNTTLLSRETNLDWQTSSEVLEGTSFEALAVTHDGDKFVIREVNQRAFDTHFSVQTFTRSASMGIYRGGNLTENDIVRRIAVSLYEDRGGIRGLSDLLDNLAVSMSNTYAPYYDRGA
ncbi:MAG: hypothetical protein Q9182_006810 [Xanthomendoza sp. 2 TL-2023]